MISADIKDQLDSQAHQLGFFPETVIVFIPWIKRNKTKTGEAPCGLIRFVTHPALQGVYHTSTGPGRTATTIIQFTLDCSSLNCVAVCWTTCNRNSVIVSPSHCPVKFPLFVFLMQQWLMQAWKNFPVARSKQPVFQNITCIYPMLNQIVEDSTVFWTVY